MVRAKKRADIHIKVKQLGDIGKVNIFGQMLTVEEQRACGDQQIFIQIKQQMDLKTRFNIMAWFRDSSLVPSPPDLNN